MNLTCLDGLLHSIWRVNLTLPGDGELRNGIRGRAATPAQHHIGEALILVGASPMTTWQHLHHHTADHACSHTTNIRPEAETPDTSSHALLSGMYATKQASQIVTFL